MDRYYWDRKDTVEECRSVSISFLKKHDYFCGLRSGGIVWKNCFGEETSSISVTVSTMYDENYVRFRYTITDRNTRDKSDYDYKVQLTTTPCNFGGVRYWFICPLSRNGIYCGQRVAKLYKAPGGYYFGCRHCYNLSYESRNESRLGRFGQLGYFLRAEKQMEELQNRIKRNFYAGKPTKKFRKLLLIQSKLNAYLDRPLINDLLRGDF